MINTKQTAGKTATESVGNKNTTTKMARTQYCTLCAKHKREAEFIPFDEDNDFLECNKCQGEQK